jgi:hypothetical protein
MTLRLHSVTNESPDEEALLLAIMSVRIISYQLLVPGTRDINSLVIKLATPSHYLHDTVYRERCMMRTHNRVCSEYNGVGIRKTAEC